MKKFPNYIQLYTKDCGPTCLKIISKHYNLSLSTNNLINICQTTRLGTSLENLSIGAEEIGFRTLIVKISLNDLKNVPLPCVLLWEKNHYVVLYNIKKAKYYISDPASGLLQFTEEEFLSKWINPGAKPSTSEGISLLLETNPDLHKIKIKNKDQGISWSFIKSFFSQQNKLIAQLFIGLLIGLIIQLIMPFITQNIVDKGIINKNIHFIYILLIAQLFLFFSLMIVQTIRSWILLHIGNRIKVSFISDFIIKLMKLPIAYYDIKKSGDILKRLEDHVRIKKLLTNTSLSFIFSIFTLLVFSGVLAFYNLNLFIIFFVGTLIYFIWFVLFLKKRAIIDKQAFKLISKDRSFIIELLRSMKDIKLNNSEIKQRAKWEEIQADLYENENKYLSIQNYQTIGADIINEIKNITLVFYSAALVLRGDITLGMLLAIMYIIAQLNNPLIQILVFIQEFQDAYLSIIRLNDINSQNFETNNNKININSLTESKTISINNVSFAYPGFKDNVLNNISFKIEPNQTTALVGKSGSGKTTLMKLLLQFYKPTAGDIIIGSTNLNNITYSSWRNYCGVVLQDGEIMNDTVLNNICLSNHEVDYKRFETAIKIANLEEFIQKLPLNDKTPIGAEGLGISGGEKQRMLIARAIYKNPETLFFDEATSSLDTENEKEIVNNLNEYLTDKSSLIIAHRLSTVERADNILVLSKGQIVESGTHDVLIEKKGYYFDLIKNQLELGQ